MDHSHDDEGLWDELNHQQSREIEQYHYQRDRARVSSSSLNWLPPAVGTVLRQTAEQVTTAVAGVINGGNNNPHSTDDDRSRNKDQRYESLSSLLPSQSSAEIEHDLGMNIFGTRQHQQQQRQEPLLSSDNNNNNSNNNLNGENNSRGTTGQNNTNTNHYVFLQPFRLLPQRDGWGAVADLDVFFASLYQYYYHRGFTTLAMKGVVELVTLFFTLALSIFLFAYVDWPELASCTEEKTCHATFSSYIIPSPFSSAHSLAWKGWVLLYSLIFFLYGVFSAWSWWHALQRAQASKSFMEEQLGIGERKLQSGAVDWDRDVVSKIKELQTTGQYRIAIHGQADETLDSLLVAQRILRKENFMIALFNNPTLLDWSVPFAPGIVFFSKSLEWTLYFCILNFMFNHKYQLRPAFYLDPNSLKRRLFLCGIAHVIFMPFLLFFMTLYFSLQNAYDWKSTKNYLGPREWSSAAKWTLREFNELPHLFERRMEPSYEAAETYLKLFRQNEIMTAIGRIMVFIGGSLGAVLFAFAAMNDAILLHVKIADWNLLWYAGVVAAIYSAGKAMLPSQEKDNKLVRTYHSNLSQEMDLALEKVATHTHHFPDVWKGRGWEKSTTYKAFSKMYKYKAHLFIQELLSIIVAPYILCVSLPRCAERICDFVLAIRAEAPGAGDVCGYCTFDFDTFGDELWEGKTFGGGDNAEPLSSNGEQQQNSPPMVTGSLSESIMQSGSVLETTQQFPIPRAKEGKMEKSFFSFKSTHPSWKCSSSGQDLVDRLEKYQEEENAAMARERQLHIQAAARQLELMARLEQNRQHSSRHGPLGPGGLVVDSRTMNDTYIGAVGNTHTAADAGAGIQRVQHPPPALAPVSEEHAASFVQSQSQRAPAVLQAIGQNVGFGVSPPGQTQPESPPFAAPAPSQHELDYPPGTASRLNRHSTVDSTSLNNLAPPPSIFPPPVPPGQLMSTTSATTNTTTGTGAMPLEGLALSSELRRILNMSTLDPDVGSVMADSTAAMPQMAAINLARSISGLPPVEEERDRAAERQYLWLERYHAHSMMASRRVHGQQQQQQQQQQQTEQQQQAEQRPPPSVAQQQHQRPMSASASESTTTISIRPNNPHPSSYNNRRMGADDKLGGSSIL